MASINFATREISCKIVYYGPGLSGKTTNLQVIHRKLPQDKRSDMVSLDTEQDRTLYFDFLPLDLGSIKGFKTKFQLYTVPGQVYYSLTRKQVLRGVDGVVFVADSQPSRMGENMESLHDLRENLKEQNIKLEDLPLVIQYNKRDLPEILEVEALQEKLNYLAAPHFEATAHNGGGVVPTLKEIAKLVIEKFNRKPAASPVAPKPAPSAPQAHAAPIAAAPVSPAPAAQAPAAPAPSFEFKAPTAEAPPFQFVPPPPATESKPKAQNWDDDADEDDIELVPYSPRQ